MVSAFPSSLLASNEDQRAEGMRSSALALSGSSALARARATGARATGRSALVIRNVSVHGHRTSIRLEPQIWDSMTEICRSEFCTPHDVCSYVAEHKPPHSSLTSSLRVFILDYFRTCATEDGHRSARHGQGMFLTEQQERKQMRSIKADRPDCARLTPDGLRPSPKRTRSGPGPA
jgi:predicted DNA-binding ribbon-helix-helix protein